MSETNPPLSRADVAHVAKLALLDLTDEEIDMFTGQLRSVLETAQAMNDLDLGDIAPTHHPLGLTNVLRADEVRPSLDRAEVLAQAPETEDDRFKDPPALGAE